MTQLRDYGRQIESDPILSVEAPVVAIASRSPQTGWRRGPVWSVAAAIAVLTVGIGLALNFNSDPEPAATPQSPFAGTWVSTEADGGDLTATFIITSDGVVEMAVTDTYASVCSGGNSTMTGTGHLQSNTLLVIPEPSYTCDDGSEPQALSGAPLEDQLRNMTFTYDPGTDTIAEGVLIWTRQGAERPTPEPTVTISDTMWPQSSLEEVQEAQERADAGDPDYTWQLDARLSSDDANEAHSYLLEPGQVELVDRFLRDVLGWEAYVYNAATSGTTPPNANFTGNGFFDMRFLRCEPGRVNPLWVPDPDRPGTSCAPTLDDLRFEEVSFDVVQLDRQGPGGIWVVSRWRTMTFAQADPAVTEPQATHRLEEFLAARVAGRDAEGYVDVYDDSLTVRQVPLLYATTSGSPYERFEFDIVDGPLWPDGGYITFSVRLFADDDATVVEQEIYSHWDGGRSVGIEGGLAFEDGSTTENGQPVPVAFTAFGSGIRDGEITYSSPHPWGSTIWFDDNIDGVIDFTDPVASWSECAQSPVPVDAAAFSQAVSADPSLETTAPVAARVGGVEAVSIDVALAPGGTLCLAGFDRDSYYFRFELQELRLRMYLVDLPDGMSMRTLLVTVMAPEDRFEEVTEEATPIIESVEFHPG